MKFGQRGAQMVISSDRMVESIRREAEFLFDMLYKSYLDHPQVGQFRDIALDRSDDICTKSRSTSGTCSYLYLEL